MVKWSNNGILNLYGAENYKNHLRSFELLKIHFTVNKLVDSKIICGNLWLEVVKSGGLW